MSGMRARSWPFRGFRVREWFLGNGVFTNFDALDSWSVNLVKMRLSGSFGSGTVYIEPEMTKDTEQYAYLTVVGDFDPKTITTRVGLNPSTDASLIL
jgi:hypothetical protein